MQELKIRHVQEQDKAQIAGVIAFGFKQDFSAFIPDMHRMAKALASEINTNMLDVMIKKTSYTEYILNVTDRNTAAQACYRKFGFTEIGHKTEKHAKQKRCHAKLYMNYCKADNNKQNV